MAPASSQARLGERMLSACMHACLFATGEAGVTTRGGDNHFTPRCVVRSHHHQTDRTRHLLGCVRSSHSTTVVHMALVGAPSPINTPSLFELLLRPGLLTF
uniref:Putative secreted protein n=1 Tax=Anopheles darlingi TaxID=43151 RepID=A0A2M4CZZ7_ANODA